MYQTLIILNITIKLMAQCILLQKVQYCLRPYTDPSKWILIDWDDAVGFPNSPSSHLTTKDHAPEAFNKNHRWQVDI
ncbi:unnamed protein product [Rhizophagus irregularis]|nr:unnamed protein product [Rhizophagus irregularis]